MTAADTREETSVHTVKATYFTSKAFFLPTCPWKSFETLFRTFSTLNTLCIIQVEHYTLSPPFWLASRALLWESPRDTSRIADSAWSRSLWARSIQPKFPEISVQNSMDRFGPTGKVTKKLVHLLRWSSFPGRTAWNFGWMDRALFFKKRSSWTGLKNRWLAENVFQRRVRKTIIADLLQGLEAARQSWKTSAHACGWLFLAHFRSFDHWKVSTSKDVVRVGDSLAITTFDKMELDEFWEQSNSCLLYTSPSPRDA